MRGVGREAGARGLGGEGKLGNGAAEGSTGMKVSAGEAPGATAAGTKDGGGGGNAPEGNEARGSAAAIADTKAVDTKWTMIHNAPHKRRKPGVPGRQARRPDAAAQAEAFARKRSGAMPEGRGRI